MDGRYEVFEVIERPQGARYWQSAFECDTKEALGVGLVQLDEDRHELGSGRLTDAGYERPEFYAVPQYAIFDHELQRWISGPRAPGIPRARAQRDFKDRMIEAVEQGVSDEHAYEHVREQLADFADSR